MGWDGGPLFRFGVVFFVRLVFTLFSCLCRSLCFLVVTFCVFFFRYELVFCDLYRGVVGPKSVSAHALLSAEDCGLVTREKSKN